MKSQLFIDGRGSLQGNRHLLHHFIHSNGEGSNKCSCLDCFCWHKRCKACCLPHWQQHNFSLSAVCSPCFPVSASRAAAERFLLSRASHHSSLLNRNWFPHVSHSSRPQSKGWTLPSLTWPEFTQRRWHKWPPPTSSDFHLNFTTAWKSKAFILLKPLQFS